MNLFTINDRENKSETLPESVRRAEPNGVQVTIFGARWDTNSCKIAERGMKEYLSVVIGKG